MKIYIWLLMMVLAAAACQPKTGNKELSTEPVVMEMSIDGMTCNGCVGTVDASIRQAGEGVNSVSVSLDSARAIVEFVPATISAEEIKKAIELNGYKVISIKNKENED